jgi:hypothetical protein
MYSRNPETLAVISTARFLIFYGTFASSESCSPQKITSQAIDSLAIGTGVETTLTA